MSSSEIINVILADDHPIFLKGVRTIIEEAKGLKVVGEAINGSMAWNLIQKVESDVAVLDLDMPEMDGLQVARRVSRHSFPVKLIMLSMHKNEDLLRQALELGVLGYIPKDDTATDLVQCIRAVASGKHFIAPSLSPYLVKRSSSPDDQEPNQLKSLSATQREVLTMIANGLTSKEIAGELGISYRTVENHRFRIAEKLGLKGSHSLLRFALENKGSI